MLGQALGLSEAEFEALQRDDYRGVTQVSEIDVSKMKLGFVIANKRIQMAGNKKSQDII